MGTPASSYVNVKSLVSGEVCGPFQEGSLANFPFMFVFKGPQGVRD